MNQGIVLYRSKYGSTKQYAEWIAEACRFDCIDLKTSKVSAVKQYENVILCGSLFASNIRGLSFYKKHAEILSHKKFAIFCVGMSAISDELLKRIQTENFKEGLRPVPLFYGRGSFDKSKMKFFDHSIMNMIKKSLAKTDPETYTEEQRIICGDIKLDWKEKTYITPVVDYFLS